MKKSIIILATVAVLIIGGVFFFGGEGSNEFVNDGSGSGKISNDSENKVIEKKEDNNKFDEVPDFSLKDYDGNEVSLSQFDGKAKIINSWAVWCPFCRQELADFAEIQKEFGEDLVVIAIDRKESLKKAKGFTDSLDITDKMIFLLDPKDSFYTSIGGFSMPETLFVDGNNNIITHKRGFMTLEEMRQKTEALLNN